jgi:lipoprotein-anchoring transpeptidase ErfK/SrfK
MTTFTPLLLAALTAASLFSSCQLSREFLANSQPQKEEIRRPILVKPADAHHSPLYVWHGGEKATAPGPLRVRIDLSQQKAYVFRMDEMLAWSYVATGRSGYTTPTGTYRISEKNANKRSTRYGKIVDAKGRIIRSNATAGVHRIPAGGHFIGTRMPYWMRLTGYGIGMHAGQIPRPGAPASHGCIRMPYTLVQQLYAIAPTGTEVSIVP